MKLGKDKLKQLQCRPLYLQSIMRFWWIPLSRQILCNHSRFCLLQSTRRLRQWREIQLRPPWYMRGLLTLWLETSRLILGREMDLCRRHSHHIKWSLQYNQLNHANRKKELMEELSTKLMELVNQSRPLIVNPPNNSSNRRACHNKKI
jgi:hypothetical protein